MPTSLPTSSTDRSLRHRSDRQRSPTPPAAIREDGSTSPFGVEAHCLPPSRNRCRCLIRPRRNYRSRARSPRQPNVSRFVGRAPVRPAPGALAPASMVWRPGAAHRTPHSPVAAAAKLRPTIEAVDGARLRNPRPCRVATAQPLPVIRGRRHRRLPVRHFRAGCCHWLSARSHAGAADRGDFAARPTVERGTARSSRSSPRAALHAPRWCGGRGRGHRTPHGPVAAAARTPLPLSKRKSTFAQSTPRTTASQSQPAPA